MMAPRIVDVVFARVDPHAWRRAGLSWAITGAVALTVVVAILLSRGPNCECGVRVAPPVVDRTLTMEAPAVAPPPAPTKIAEPSRLRSEPDPPAARHSSPAKQAPPTFAQAGSILAREPSPNEPVDLTGQAFVTGSGTVYGGGLTTSSGTSSAAVRLAPAPTQGKVPRSSAMPDRSRPVGLPDPSWTCPWPEGTEAQAFDEQSAFVQVTVRPDGSVGRAVVLTDPGFGFGEAAQRCATSARFAPAMNADGAPIRAVSPPIRVRFVR